MGIASRPVGRSCESLGIAVSRWKTSILAQTQKASRAPLGHFHFGRLAMPENSNGPYLLGFIAGLCCRGRLEHQWYTNHGEPKSRKQDSSSAPQIAVVTEIGPEGPGLDRFEGRAQLLSIVAQARERVAHTGHDLRHLRGQ